MNLINQKNGVDCGLAVAAMITGKAYDNAADVDPDPDSERGLGLQDFLWVLAGLTGVEWQASRAQYRRPLNAATLPQTQCAILIRRPQDKFGHWVAFDGAQVFDPERPVAMPVAKYDRSDWQIIRIVYLPPRAP